MHHPATQHRSATSTRKSPFMSGSFSRSSEVAGRGGWTTGKQKAATGSAATQGVGHGVRGVGRGRGAWSIAACRGMGQERV